MNDEIRSFLKVWMTIIMSLSYSYLVSSRFPKGIMRFLSLIPVILTFLLIPMIFSSVALQLFSGIFIAWLANFKLLLFAFDKQPFSTSSSSLSLLDFILNTSLPIKIKEQKSHITKNINDLKSLVYFTVNVGFWFLMVHSHKYNEYMHPYVIRVVYTFHMTLGTVLILRLVALMAWFLLGKEVEQHFDNPHLSTSLQNFWGRRWNLMVSNILRSTIDEPIIYHLTPLLGRRWALHFASVTTFLVSGLMHEMAYYYVKREWPTWELLCFFTIHGFCVAIEVEVKKKALKSGRKLRPIISTFLTVGFVMVTGTWLIYAELIQYGADVKEMEELMALSNYVKHIFHNSFSFY
ncbi:hypothetical protein AQUCO_02800168v1 [Aquilegia coerulea]|uniref:Wax synthase domain-containing protein n=1 Tax=Aquilegia coerulea TaxID=218851 RepID=A0A2G5D469_AQUCA|nr:hypothetical protein AQUCO_02800168v1 [Aquilegia coerulea]